MPAQHQRRTGTDPKNRPPMTIPRAVIAGLLGAANLTASWTLILMLAHKALPASAFVVATWLLGAALIVLTIHLAITNALKEPR